MVYRILGTFIMIAAATVGYLVFKDNFQIAPDSSRCAQLTPGEQLAQLIGDDFASLEKKKQLPAAWKKIATIDIRMNSQLAKALLGKRMIGFKRVQDGTHFLEMEFLDLPDEANPGIIVQASLFENKSKNKIFEIGRTYTMNDLNKTTKSLEEESPQMKKGK